MPIDKTVDDAARAAAKIFLDTKSVLFNSREPFVFTSGRVSPVYVDTRRLISFPKERDFLMDAAAKLLREKVGDDKLDFLAGGETAGIPFAAFISDRLNKPMLYVRKKPKGFGRMAQIEGCIAEEGKYAVMIEDLQTDGGSKKVFIDVLRDAGCKVEHSFVVFHYGILEKSEENNKAMGVTLHALTNWWAILDVARDLKYFDDETLNAVEEFLNGPDAWAEANAHKAKPKEAQA
jgi:orotate phosphoribosyltransferase